MAQTFIAVSYSEVDIGAYRVDLLDLRYVRRSFNVGGSRCEEGSAETFVKAEARRATCPA